VRFEHPRHGPEASRLTSFESRTLSADATGKVKITGDHRRRNRPVGQASAANMHRWHPSGSPTVPYRLIPPQRLRCRNLAFCACLPRPVAVKRQPPVPNWIRRRPRLSSRRSEGDQCRIQNVWIEIILQSSQHQFFGTSRPSVAPFGVRIGHAGCRRDQGERKTTPDAVRAGNQNPRGTVRGRKLCPNTEMPERCSQPVIRPGGTKAFSCGDDEGGKPCFPIGSQRSRNTPRDEISAPGDLAEVARSHRRRRQHPVHVAHFHLAPVQYGRSRQSAARRPPVRGPSCRTTIGPTPNNRMVRKTLAI
jgi:hypothetical protein